MKGVDLMSSLFSADLDQLRDAFLARSEGVDEHDFVLLLLRHCPELRQTAISTKHSMQRQQLREKWFESHQEEAASLNCTRIALPSLDETVSGGFHSTTSLMHGSLTTGDLADDLDEEGKDAVHQLFHSIDCDGDGNVTWEEVYNFAISTTMQRLEPRPAERIRPYALAHEAPRDDNVYSLQYFKHHDVLCVSSRHNPLQLLNVSTFKPILSAPITHFAVDEMVTATCHVPETDVLCAFTNHLNLKSWCVVNSRLQPLPTIVSEEYISHLLVPNTMPGVLFAGTSVGTLKLYDVTRHAEPRLRCTIPVHTTGECVPGAVSVPGIGRRTTEATGDIMTTFTFITPLEHRIVSTAYDQRICITDLNAVESSFTTDMPSASVEGYRKPQRAVSCIGQSESVITHLEYCESYHLIMAGGMNRQISAWVPHASHSPKTVFEDLAAPHTARLVGLTSIPGSPQLISTDANGIMKIWDIRTFRCTQTTKIFKKENQTETDASDDVLGRGQGGGDGDLGDRRRACGAVYVSSTKQVVAADSNGFTSYWYDPGANPSLADPQHIISIATNPFADTIITLTATSVGIWDAAEGALNSHHRLTDVGKADATVCFVDDRVRRIIVGFADGYLRTYGYHGLAPLKKMHLHTKDITAAFYHSDLRAIYTCSLDGSLACWLEKDPGSPVSRIRFSIGGLTCMSHNRELSVIVLGSTTGRICLVDLTHPRVNVGESEGIPGVAVKCISMIGNYPLFVVAFVNGAVRVYTCRPALDVVAVFGFDVSDRLRLPADRCAWGQHDSRLKSTTGRLVSPTSRGATSEASDPYNFSRNSRTAGKVIDDSANPTAMRVDLVTHTLWIGDTGGWVTGWQLCPLLQALRIQPTAFPGTPMFEVDATAALGLQLPMVASFAAHRDDVVTLELVSEQGCIATSGDDRRVILWSPTGQSFGELCFGRRGAESLSADNASAVQDITSPVKHRKLGGRRQGATASQVVDDEVIPPYNVQRVHTVPAPPAGLCQHEVLLDRSLAAAEESSHGSKDGLHSRGPFSGTTGDEPVVGSAVVPLMIDTGDDSVELLGNAANESGHVSTRNRPLAVNPSMSLCAPQTPVMPIQPKSLKESRSKAWRIGRAAQIEEHARPLSPRDEAQTSQHLSTLLGHRTRAAVEERMRWERDTTESASIRRTVTEVVSPSDEQPREDAPSAPPPTMEPETCLNSPRELSARLARDLAERPAHIPAIAGLNPASETLLKLHDIASRGPARASITATLSKALVPAKLPPRPPGAPRQPTAPSDQPSPDAQVMPPSLQSSRSPLLSHSLFHVAGVVSQSASPAPSLPPPPLPAAPGASRNIFNLIVTPRTITRPAPIAPSPSDDQSVRPRTSDSTAPKIPSLVPSRATSATSARSEAPLRPFPHHHSAHSQSLTPRVPSSGRTHDSYHAVSEDTTPSPRKGLALGSVKLGRKIEVPVRVKPDTRLRRQELLKRELHKCILGSSHGGDGSSPSL